jgi:hypothetical protein
LTRIVCCAVTDATVNAEAQKTPKIVRPIMVMLSQNSRAARKDGALNTE